MTNHFRDLKRHSLSSGLSPGRLSYPDLQHPLQKLRAKNSSLLTSGLIAYYKLDEGSGTSAADSSGTGNTAGLGGSTDLPTWAPGGVVNDCLSFDGTDDYLSTANFLGLTATKQATLAYWWNYGATWPSGAGILFELSNNFNLHNGTFNTNINADNPGGIACDLRTGSGWTNNAYNIRTVSPPSAGVFHHYVWVLDRSQGGSAAITLYLDGALTPTAQDSFYNGTMNDDFASLPLYIMSRAGSSLFTAGKIDEIAIWSRALSAAEVTALYNNGNGLQYPF